MTDGRRGARVTLDRERRLRYTLAAIDAIQERFGVNVLAGDPLPFDNLDDLTWLVWLGLKHAGETPDADLGWWNRLLLHFGLKDPPALTEDVVAEWVDLENIREVTEALAQAMGSNIDGDDMEDMPQLNPTKTERKSA